MPKETGSESGNSSENNKNACSKITKVTKVLRDHIYMGKDLKMGMMYMMQTM